MSDRVVLSASLHVTSQGKTHFIYEKEIHFKISLLQPPCFTRLSSLPGSASSSRCLAWARSRKRLRPIKRPKNQPQHDRTLPARKAPDVVRTVGAVRLDQDLRSLPYIAPRPSSKRDPNALPTMGRVEKRPTGRFGLAYVQSLLKNDLGAQPRPCLGRLLTFEGIGNTCGCQPSDSEGDVGPNHYIEAINESFKIFDKNGNTLAGPTSYNSFFAALTGTPCGSNQNDGDPYVIYDRRSLGDQRLCLSGVSWQVHSMNASVCHKPDPVSGRLVPLALRGQATDFLVITPSSPCGIDSRAANAYFLHDQLI